MNTVDYIKQYEYCAIALLIVLMLIYSVRRKYPGTSNIVYFSMLVCTSLSAATHIAAMATLPIAYNLPEWLNYVIHISYLFFYDMEAILYLAYIFALTRRNKLSRANLIATGSVILVEILLLFTTPLTKLIIYFDEEMNYLHGPLFYVFPTLSLAMVILGTVLFVKFRRNHNRTHLVVVITFVVLNLAATVLQLYRSDQVVGNFFSALGFVMLLILVQNPDDYTDRDLDCFNDDAFYLTIDLKLEQEEKFSTAVFRLEQLNVVNGQYHSEEQGVPLEVVAKRLNAKFKDQVFYLGEWEFALFTNEHKGLDEQALIDDIEKFFENPIVAGSAKAVMVPRICVVRCPEIAKSPEEVRNLLKYTMRLAQNTKDGVYIATKKSVESQTREQQILTAIKTAIVNDGFDVYYQPIYDTKRKGFISSEALIRLRDEKLGFISPDEFIPMAEANGMIIQIGEIVFKKVCEFLKSGKAQALGVEYVEVNLSVMQCVQESLADRLLEIVTEYGIPTNQINLEITETAGLANQDCLLRNMQRLIDSGMTFSMDDYGTGFSTAYYLISLPMDYVKIDKSILWPAMESDEALIILKHTVEMLISLGKKIIVEGVETEEMKDMLTDMGCHYLQGFYFQRPIPQSQYLDFLQKNYNQPEKICVFNRSDPKIYKKFRDMI